MTNTQIGLKKTGNPIATILLSILSVFLWVYAVFKLVIIDIDVLFLNLISPDLVYILNFKFIFFLIVVFLASTILGIKRLFLNLAYLLFFPILLVFAYIPFWGFRLSGGFFLITYFNSIINFFRNTKMNLFKTIIYICGAIFVIHSRNWPLFSFGCFLLSIHLISHFFERFITALKPSRYLALDEKSLKTTLSSKFFLHYTNVFPEEDPDKDLNPINLRVVTQKSELSEKAFRHLEGILQYTNALLNGAKILFFLQKRKMYVFFFLFSITATFLLTVLTFSFLNFGAYLVDENSFTTTLKPGFFEFLYYSFSTFTINSVDIISPNSTLTRIFSMIHVALNYVTFAFLLTIFFSTSSEEFQSNIDSMIFDLKETVRKIDEKFKNEHFMDLEGLNTMVGQLKKQSKSG
jgi:hypothetical protein